MISVVYTPGFFSLYNKLPEPLQKEVEEKIELFKKDPRHPFLKTHKLKGRLRGRYSFWVNYRTRVLFVYDSASVVALLAVGDHDVYKI